MKKKYSNWILEFGNNNNRIRYVKVCIIQSKYAVPFFYGLWLRINQLIMTFEHLQLFFIFNHSIFEQQIDSFGLSSFFAIFIISNLLTK